MSWLNPWQNNVCIWLHSDIIQIKINWVKAGFTNVCKELQNGNLKYYLVYFRAKITTSAAIKRLQYCVWWQPFKSSAAVFEYWTPPSPLLTLVAATIDLYDPCCLHASLQNQSWSSWSACSGFVHDWWKLGTSAEFVAVLDHNHLYLKWGEKMRWFMRQPNCLYITLRSGV